MNFREAESYLLSLGNEVETMKLGLDNVRTLLSALGDPQTGYIKLQVAGTNGKGSVCAFLGSICQEAGIRTGVFTSPHLISITERVRINGTDISDIEFAQLATLVRETSERLVAGGELKYTPTFFEQVTATALLAFEKAGVDVAILETGLGGRLDATTAANADIAVITRIDLDHQEYLGNTIEEIASEKAAIIRAGSTVVIGEQPDSAMRVLRDRCRILGIIPQLANREYAPELGTKPGLPGRHQIENARTAAIAARALRNGYGLKISEDQITCGIEAARHPGRLERVGNILFDGAHNIGGAAALRGFLDEFVMEPVTMIFGAVKDKDIARIASTLFPKARTVILTKMQNSRAATAEEMTAMLSDIVPSIMRVHLTSNVGEALRKARETAGDKGLIVVTGSLYLVGEVKKLLRSEI